MNLFNSRLVLPLKLQSLICYYYRPNLVFLLYLVISLKLVNELSQLAVLRTVIFLKD